MLSVNNAVVYKDTLAVDRISDEAAFDEWREARLLLAKIVLIQHPQADSMENDTEMKEMQMLWKQSCFGNLS